jgi:DNA-binding transcriptional LysR family regulator
MAHVMESNPQSTERERELDLHHLQIFEVLLHERSLTRAARVLDLTQPALSKTLARLRLYFNDPLFIRVAMRMEPTPKALELAEPVHAILERMRTLRTDHAAFDPQTSERKFNFFMIDAAMVAMLPPFLNLLSTEAPHIHIQAIHCDLQHLDLWLESGVVDFAVGSFPSLLHGIRRHTLWREGYAVVARQGHPRLRDALELADFTAEKHVLVSAVGTGHEHLATERILENTIPARHIVCRVPTFIAAAHIARQSDVLATLPRTLAKAMERDLGLQVFEPPLALPAMEIAQYWHDRFHRDAGHQWLRNAFRDMFRREHNAPHTAS